MVLKVEIMSTHRILDGALSLAMKYSHFDTTRLTVNALASWDSYAMLVVIRRILFISWEPPPLKFLKINFDGSVRDYKGVLALSSMIQIPDNWLWRSFIFLSPLSRKRSSELLR